MSAVTVRQLTDAVCAHGEGPAWSSRWAGPRVLDMLEGAVLELADDGDVTRRQVGGSVAALVRARRGGGWLVATQHGVSYADEDAIDAPLTEGPRLWTDDAVRANEGSCDPAGTLYLGSMAWDAAPGMGTLVELEPGGAKREVLRGLTISNGLGWTADGARAYYVDSGTGVIEAFDWAVETGLVGRREWAVVEGGGADGLAVDTDGGVWVAIVRQGAVHHYDNTGRLVDVIAMPVRQPTAVAFVGPRLDRLIVTTSQYALDDPEPAAGAVFEITGHGVRGVPLNEFAG